MDLAKTRKIARYTAILALTLAAASLAGTSHATIFTWDGYMTSSWGYSRNVGSVIVPVINSNWEPDGTSSLQLPTSLDPVIFGEYTTSNRVVNLNGTRSAYSLEFKNAQNFKLTNGTLLLSSGNLTSTNTSTQTLDADVTLQSNGLWNVSSAPVVVNGRIFSSSNLTKTGGESLYLTNNNNLLRETIINEGAILISNNGSLTNSSGYIGDTTNGTYAAAYVSGANAMWTNTEGIHVGSLGYGRLDITSGGTVTSSKGIIGESAGSQGTASLFGANSTWDTGYLSIGERGHGILNIASGSTVTSTSSSISSSIGRFPGSSGIVTVTGANSTWNTRTLSVGGSGEGILNIEDGGTVLSTSASIGGISSSTNIATVTGSNSKWNITGGLSLSSFGTSSILNIEDGGTVSNSSARMGFLEIAFATSVVTVTGSNSTWNTSGDLDVGISLGDSDISTNSSTINIESGGTVSVENEIYLAKTGVINLRGGTLRAATFGFYNEKAINFEAGKLQLTQNTTINSSNIYDLDVNQLINGQTLRVDGITTLQTPLTLNGGKLSTDSIVGFNNLDFQSGYFDLTYSNFSIGSAGIAGPNVNLPSGKHFNVTNNASIAANGVLNLSGGSFSAAKLTNNGTIIASGNTISFFGTGDPGKELVHNGLEIRTTAGSGLVLYAPVSGSGNFTGPGDVYFTTDYSPGTSTGVVNFEGNVNFLGYGPNGEDDGFLNMELAGLLSGEFDQLIIAGDVSLDGNLAVDLLGGFMLSPGSEFKILDIAGTLTGQFDGLGEGDLVGNFSGKDLFISYNAGDGNDVALFTPGISGDFDSDNDVDGFDFFNWQRGNYGNSLATWSANYGTSSSPAIAALTTAVPEPSTGMLLVIGITTMLCGQRKQRQNPIRKS